MNAAIDKVKKASEGDDATAIKQATEELDAASQAFSKVLYEKTGGEGAAADAGGQPAAAAADNDDDAIDADFEVKD